MILLVFAAYASAPWSLFNAVAELLEFFHEKPTIRIFVDAATMVVPLLASTADPLFPRERAVFRFYVYSKNKN